MTLFLSRDWRKSISTFLIVSGLGLSANAMQQQSAAQITGQHPCPVLKCPPKETCVDGDTVTCIDKHHKWTVYVTETTTKKLKKDINWTDGKETVDIPKCKKKEPKEKKEECWVPQTSQSQNCNKNMQTDKVCDEEQGPVTHRTYCQHNEEIYVTEVTNHSYETCKEWDDETQVIRTPACNQGPRGPQQCGSGGVQQSCQTPRQTKS